MSLKKKDIAKKVLKIIQDMPEEALEKLVSSWDSGEEIHKHNLERITGISGEKIRRLDMLIGDPEVNHDLVNAMIVTGLEAKSKFAASNDDVEIVWTGPSKISVGVRNTKPVIEEMLKSAVPGERITIIDYVITSNAEILRSPSLISRLSRNAIVGSSMLRMFNAAMIQAPIVISLDQFLSRISTVVSLMIIQAVRRLTVTVRRWWRQPAKLATKLDIY